MEPASQIAAPLQPLSTKSQSRSDVEPPPSAHRPLARLPLNVQCVAVKDTAGPCKQRLVAGMGELHTAVALEYLDDSVASAQVTAQAIFKTVTIRPWATGSVADGTTGVLVGATQLAPAAAAPAQATCLAVIRQGSNTVVYEGRTHLQNAAVATARRRLTPVHRQVHSACGPDAVCLRRMAHAHVVELDRDRCPRVYRTLDLDESQVLEVPARGGEVAWARDANVAEGARRRDAQHKLPAHRHCRSKACSGYMYW